MYTVLNSPQKISRAYAQSIYGDSLPSVFLNLSGRTPQLWEYISSDSVGVVQSNNYFSNGGFLGMSVGDVIFVREVPEENESAVTVTSSTPGGAATAASNLDRFNSDASGNVTALTGPEGSVSLPIPNFGYHFHGFAGNQLADDSVFYDISGVNHAVRGANLSKAQLWTTAVGYASTIDPVGGSTDSVLRIPSINFDYSGGEKLIIWALGKWTPEGSTASMLGDGSSTSLRGWRVLVPTSGKVQIVLDGASSLFSGSTTSVAFDGTLHSFGVVIDGSAKKYGMWVDEVIDAALFSGGYGLLSSGTDADTKTSNTVNIGSTTASPGGTTGIATTIRSLVIIRLPAAYPVPSIARITSAFQQLRANPGKLLLASAL